MAVYVKSGKTLNNLKEIPFELERNLQNLVEDNLETVLNLKLIKSEFSIKDKRFDTLAFDTYTNSFVIIEYKRGKNFSVIDQGMTYLGLLLDNKAEFILAYQDKFNKTIKKDDIHWDESRVIFVSTSFTDFQTSATFQNLPIELLQVNQYSNDIIITTPIRKTNASDDAVKILSESKDKSFENIAKEIKVYTEDDHLREADEKTRELYEDLKSEILNLDSEIEVKPKKMYIAFKKQSNICDVRPLSKKETGLRIYVNAKVGTLDDPKHLFKDVSKVGHWGNGDYWIDITDDTEFAYIMKVLKTLL